MHPFNVNEYCNAYAAFISFPHVSWAGFIRFREIEKHTSHSLCMEYATPSNWLLLANSNNQIRL